MLNLRLAVLAVAVMSVAYVALTLAYAPSPGGADASVRIHIWP